jgi:hypothetical protein
LALDKGGKPGLESSHSLALSGIAAKMLTAA